MAKRMTKTNEEVCQECVVPTEEKDDVVEQKAERVFKDNDMIACVSITPGEYLFEGAKSKTVYSWIDNGTTEEMRYDDLITAIRQRSACIYKPRIIVQDEDVVAQYPELQRLYDQIYSKDDLSSIFALDAAKMVDVINGLPEGAKEAVKTLAVNRISNGTLDSVAKVRALDQIFGTDMLLKMAQ